jgi:stage II sporulation protein D
MCALALAPATVHAETSPTSYDPLVRVHLARFFGDATTLTILAADPLIVTTKAGAVRYSANSQVVISAAAPGADPQSLNRGISGGCALSAGQTVALKAASMEGDDPITIARSGQRARSYRGTIEITEMPSGALLVIDNLPLEEYLMGVVGPEIGSDAPLEALKAQAVAARTYSVKNFGKCAGDGGAADLDDTTRCQSYLGVSAESPRCREAVMATAGKIVTYNGSPIDAVYATDCGGETAPGTAPYLRPVADADCAAAPPWTLAVAIPDFIAALNKAGAPSLTNVTEVSVTARDDSGRVTSLTIADDSTGATYAISGAKLRAALGYDKLRSALFDVKLDATDHTCQFIGHGWGHGLGMCQRGAVAMAREHGATYDQILDHYYAGIEISDLTSDFLQEDSDTDRDVSLNTPLEPSRPAAAPTVAFAHRRAARTWISARLPVAQPGP